MKFEECMTPVELRDSLLQVLNYPGPSGSEAAKLYHYTYATAASGILKDGYIWLGKQIR